METISINQTTLHSKAYQVLIANKQAITFKQRLALVLGAKQNQRPVKEWK